jgi:hypothetical protein
MGADRHVKLRRLITVGEDLWHPFGEAVGDKNRAEVIRRFIAWYLRRPGATLPQRPPARED